MLQMMCVSPFIGGIPHATEYILVEQDPVVLIEQTLPKTRKK